MSASLVGSEMCIRDSSCRAASAAVAQAGPSPSPSPSDGAGPGEALRGGCLLYTSDAADDM
eukprot:74516-Alexandrium_andersonii.AAC.1